jgi:hypothetical protein
VIIATIACNNYLPKAMFLAQTARAYHPDVTIILGLVEKSIHDEAVDCGLFDRVVVARDLYADDFEAFIFTHDVIEASTAIKPRLLRWAFSEYSEERLVVYLDPDIWVFDSFDELFDDEGTFDIAVTPHQLRDEPTAGAVHDNVLRTLQCGVFNLGFLALTRSQTTDEFLNWWDSRLRIYCYIDFPKGLFVDQKWVDFALSFFDLCVLRHPGYNVANWNISQRWIEEVEDNKFLVNGLPLKFVHFSGIDTGKDLWVFQKYVPNPDAVIHELRQSYLQHIGSFDRNALSQEPWSYGFFDSGEPIAPEARIAGRYDPTFLELHPQPFKESNEAFRGPAQVP